MLVEIYFAANFFGLFCKRSFIFQVLKQSIMLLTYLGLANV